MRRRLPSLNALRAFEAAARLGSMTAAAAELCVTHGAVSRQVRALQDELGVPLFEPRIQPLRLTAAGQVLLPVLTRALDQVAATVSAIKGDAEQVLDVSCLSTFAMRWLIPRLHRFHERHPGIEVRLSTTSQAVQVERDRYDVAIGVEEAKPTVAIEPPDDVAVLLFEEQLGLVLAPSLASKWMGLPQVQAAKALARCPRLHTRTRPSAWDEWGRAAGARLAPAPSREFPHYTYTLEAALGGLGMCIAPWHLVIGDVRSGRLIAPLGFVPSGLRYVADQRRAAPAAAAWLCDWLRDEARRDPQHPPWSL